jgi:hypothetical protein
MMSVDKNLYLYKKKVYSVFVRLDEFGFDSFERKYFGEALPADLHPVLVAFLDMMWDL